MTYRPSFIHLRNYNKQVGDSMGSIWIITILIAVFSILVAISISLISADQGGFKVTKWD